MENIDINDAHNLILVSEYVNDIYAYMNYLEEKFPIHENYLADQKDVTPKMRAVLIDWLNEVHMQFSMMPETFFMCVSIVDRYLQVSTMLFCPSNVLCPPYWLSKLCCGG